MFKPKLENDPVFQTLISNYERAVKHYRRVTTELRRLYTLQEAPESIRAALYQQIAHDAGLQLTEAIEGLTRFAWELTPHSSDPDHLDQVKHKREEAVKRMVLPSDDHKGVSITMRINGRTRHFQE